jgi:hypothetical protein
MVELCLHYSIRLPGMVLHSLSICSRDSSVGVASRLQNGRLRSRDSIPDRGKRFFSVHNVQTGSTAHPASYTMGNGSNAAGV